MPAAPPLRRLNSPQRVRGSSPCRPCRVDGGSFPAARLASRRVPDRPASATRGATPRGSTPAASIECSARQTAAEEQAPRGVRVKLNAATRQPLPGTRVKTCRGRSRTLSAAIAICAATHAMTAALREISSAAEGSRTRTGLPIGRGPLPLYSLSRPASSASVTQTVLAGWSKTASSSRCSSGPSRRTEAAATNGKAAATRRHRYWYQYVRATPALSKALPVPQMRALRRHAQLCEWQSQLFLWHPRRHGDLTHLAVTSI